MQCRKIGDQTFYHSTLQPDKRPNQRGHRLTITGERTLTPVLVHHCVLNYRTSHNNDLKTEFNVREQEDNKRTLSDQVMQVHVPH